MPLKIKQIRCAALTACLIGVCGFYAPFPAAAMGDMDALMNKMRVGQDDRMYYQHTAATTPAPVVIVLQGDGGSINDARKLGFEELADTQGFTTIYPKTIKRQWNDGRRSDFVRETNIDDVGFIKAIIDKLVEDKVADPQRIYITGFSDGGIMAYRAACELADSVAAIAPVSASMPAGYQYICKPARAVPVLAINGTNDSTVPWSGGKFNSRDYKNDNGEVLAVKMSLGFWHKRDRCLKKPINDSVAQQVNSSVFSVVRVHHWEGCDVQLYEIVGAQHGWPGRASAVAFNREAASGESNQMDATQVIWNFFKDKVRTPVK